MKHRRLQNLLTGLLILAMLFSLMSTTAFAEEPSETFVAATEKTGTGSIVVTVYDQDPGSAGTGAQITDGLSNPVDGVGINAKRIGSVVELTTTTTEGSTVTTNIQVAFGLDSTAVTSLGLDSTAPIATNSGISYFAPTVVQAALSGVSQSELEEYAATGSVGSNSVITDDNGVATFSNLEAGVYLLAKSELPAESTTDLAPFLVSVPMYVDGEWKTDVYAYPKVRTETIPLTKAAGVPADDSYVNAGETIPFTVTATIPAQKTGGGSTKPFTSFVITDTNPSKTLNLDMLSLAIQLNNAPLTGIGEGTYDSSDNKGEYDYYYTYTDVTTPSASSVLTITLTDTGLAKINTVADPAQQKTLTVTYNATVATDVTFSTVLTNNAVLTYNRGSGTVTSDAATVNLYTYGIDLTKTLSDNQDSISGNEIQFALYSDQECTTGHEIPMVSGNGGYWRAVDGESPATMSVDAATSHLKLYGLAPGTYYLKETATMDGYTKLDAPITIVITAPAEAGDEPTAKVNNADAQVTGGVVSLSVVNTKTEAGFTLPQTGGDGTLLVTAIGLGLLFLGVILLVAYRRKPRT